LDDKLGDTAEFLKENPTGTVIVSIKMDFGVNVKDFYKSFRSRYIRFAKRPVAHGKQDTEARSGSRQNSAYEALYARHKRPLLC
jgi:hypothetical protein